MKTVWMVTEGIYSEYHVVGIFSTKEGAKIIENFCNKDQLRDTEIKEVILDAGLEKLNQGFFLYRVHMDADGKVKSCVPLFSSYDIGERPALHVVSRPCAAGDVICGNTWAKDEQHAVKIANEFRLQAQAKGTMKPRRGK